MIFTALGASVTQQRLAHDTGEITGYLEVFAQKYAADLGFSEVRARVYGGNRASDGGLILAQRVGWEKADLCLFECNIEDHNRGRALTQDEAYYIFKSIIGSGALPVVLLLPTMKAGDARNLPAFPLFAEICARLNIPSIVIDIDDIAEPDLYFRGAHTRPLGAEMFAQRIVEQLRMMDLTPQGLAALRDGIAAFDTPIEVKRLARTNGGVGLAGRLELKSDAPRDLRLVQRQTIGPHSPVISVRVNGGAAQHVSIWDPHCHYERLSFVTLFDGSVPEEAVIEWTVVARDPDYETCHREGISWPAAQARDLRPQDDIFAISSGAIDLVGCAFSGV